MMDCARALGAEQQQHAVEPVTIGGVLMAMGRHDATEPVACPVRGCRAAAFSYTLDRFVCTSCGAHGGVIELAQVLGLRRLDDARQLVAVLGDSRPYRRRDPRSLARLRAWRRGIAHRAAIRPIEDARRERERDACAVARAYGSVR